MVGFSFIELVLLLGFPSDLPLGMPPAPEDPKIAAVAPAECLAYLSWAGTAKPSADSANHTERFLADPEIRRSLNEFKTRLTAAVKQGAGGGEKATMVANEIPKIVEIALTSPVAFFVEEFTPTPRPQISAGLVIGLGERADEFHASWKKLEETLGQKPEMVKDGDVDWSVMPAPKAAGIDARWTISNGYFVLAFGDRVGPKILDRMKDGKPAAWHAELRQRLSVPRVSTMSYVNVRKIVEMLTTTVAGVGGPPGRPGPAEVIEKLGLTKIAFLGAVSGLDETGVVSRSWLKLDERPTAFLKLFDGAALAAADLKPIPADATLAAAFRFDAERTMKEFLKVLEVAGARPGPGNGPGNDPFRELDELSREIGFSIREDFLPALGDTWRLWHSPSEGGSLFTNWTAVVSVRDPKKMAEIATVVAFKAREARRLQKEQNPGRGARFVSVEQVKEGDHEISFLNFVGEDAPVAPAWCLNGDELIVSTFPQGVRAYLNRREEKTPFAQLPDVAARLKDKTAPTAILRHDSAEIAKALYPLALHFGNILVGELQREGVNVDISIVPGLPAFLRHLQPGSMSVVPADDGIEFVSRRTLPISIGPGGVGAPLFALFGVRRASFRGGGAPASMAAALSPERAGRTKSMNNLKQIGLAMHNFHDVHKTFPAAATRPRNASKNPAKGPVKKDDAKQDEVKKDDVKKDGDKKEKPLLSWRVQILPFIEQAPLFNEFRQDEPWDSEHNKKLIARMPDVFKAPGSKAGEGKTNYVTIRGDATIFPGTSGVRMTDIVDGTSNTIMVVEASDKAAVTWTAPDDLPLDEKNPINNLVGLRPGGFVAGMADGSVRFISEKIDLKTLLNLFLRNDGNVLGEF